MYYDHMKRCLQWLDLYLSGQASKRRTQAKAVGRSQRTVSRYHRLVEQAHAQVSTSHGTPARRQATRLRREPDLHRLGRCAQLLEMEHSGVRTTAQALAAQFAVAKRTIRRDLDLIEEAIERRSQLVRRRAKRRIG